MPSQAKLVWLRPRNHEPAQCLIAFTLARADVSRQRARKPCLLRHTSAARLIETAVRLQCHETIADGMFDRYCDPLCFCC